jgi:hypothetical protein
LYWLGSSKGSRHLTHKPKSKKPVEPSGSSANIDIEPEQQDTQLIDEVIDKLGASDTRAKLKEKLAKDQCSMQ